MSDEAATHIRLSTRYIHAEQCVVTCFQCPNAHDWALVGVVLALSIAGIALAWNADHLLYPVARAGEVCFGIFVIVLGWYGSLGKLLNRSLFEIDASVVSFKERPFPAVRSSRIPTDVIRGFTATTNRAENEVQETHSVIVIIRDGAPRALRLELRTLEDGARVADALFKALQRVRGGSSAYRG